MHSSPLSNAYLHLVGQGGLQPDAGQERALQPLLALEAALTKRERHRRKPFFLRWFGRPAEPAGLYLYGPVGRGKSMLADLLYHHAPSARKQRMHFHVFMQDVHARIHVYRQRFTAPGNPVVETAKAIAREVSFLYLDELQVQDVADAMILSQFFTTLFEEGTVVLATSNRAPEALYNQGLQRERFLKFVDLIREEMQVVPLEGPQDYRLQQVQALEKTYLHPLGPGAQAALEKIIDGFRKGAPLLPLEIQVQGRILTLQTVDSKLACCSFEELCAQPLGAQDYLAIAGQFEVVMLSDIPRMGPEKRNEAKRFVTLIDALYEHRVKLIATAEAPPAELYEAGDGSFEFERTASRLIEMQSERYLGASHLDGIALI